MRFRLTQFFDSNSTPTPLLCFKNWLLLRMWLLIKQNLTTPALLLLFNSCITIYVDCEFTSKCKKHSAKITPAPGLLLLLLRLLSNQKYPLLVLLRLMLKNANSCRSRLLYSGSCTPEMSGLCFLDFESDSIN